MVVTKEDTELLANTIEEIHNDIVSATASGVHEKNRGLPTGGEPGVRDEGGLHVLAYRILSMKEKNADTIAIGTEVLREMAVNHYFWDGNKRTAYVVAKTLMRADGVNLKPDYEDALDFIIKVADKKVNKPEVQRWIKENSL